MKIGVFDRFWQTTGGGERFAGGIAEALSDEHEVSIIGPAPIDREFLSERLHLDLTRVSIHELGKKESAAEASRSYDLFINASFTSHDVNRAPLGMYVVHFPDRKFTKSFGTRTLDAVGPRLTRGHGAITCVNGFHDAESNRYCQYRWTNGNGVLEVQKPGELTLAFGHFVLGRKERNVRIVVNGKCVDEFVLMPSRSKFEVGLPLKRKVLLTDSTSIVEIESEASEPHEYLDNGDHRKLGVPLVAAFLGKQPLGVPLTNISMHWLPSPDHHWLDTYQMVLANSKFTQGWIEKWWEVESEILEPPVTMYPAGEKTKSIVSVGRFFPPGRGHAKMQHELVAAFKQLHESGAAEGWELHLAGGCSPKDEPYLNEVKALAAGLPVHFHINATGAEVASLYTHASVYWHATGLGLRLEKDPISAEHFGITTVEAMSAGCVPIVVASGGQPDIVRNGVSGFLFSSREELTSITAAVINDPPRMKQLGENAARDAQYYSTKEFKTRLRDYVNRLAESAS